LNNNINKGLDTLRFIFFTKTNWDEPPRLRHQLAHLLVGAGHEIVFFEVPSYPWDFTKKSSPSPKQIKLTRTKQFLHHKLRLSRLLHFLNAVFEKQQIREKTLFHGINDQDVIVNFNYDYYFLRDIFTSNRIITVINDNFWCRALGGYEKPLRYALRRTCEDSNHVLTVSTVLQDELARYCNPHIFHPWSGDGYLAPKSNVTRRTLLFWGYIGERLDIDLLVELSSVISNHSLNYRILLVGPIVGSHSTVDRLRNNPVIEFAESSTLDELDFSDVLAALIPYRSTPEIDACELPNKALQLLGRGLPLLVSGMPHFVDKPFVYRLSLSSDYLKTLNRIEREFQRLPEEIKLFVNNNTGEARLKTLLALIGKSES